MTSTLAMPVTTLEQQGKAWVLTLPTRDHPDGLRLVVTNQLFRGEIPFRICSQCGHSLPFPAFLKPGKVCRDGYYSLMGGDECHVCDPPGLVPLHKGPDGHLRMRLSRLRGDGGQPIRFYDHKDSRWRAASHVGLRLMRPNGNEIRLQPYSNAARAVYRDKRSKKEFLTNSLFANEVVREVYARACQECGHQQEARHPNTYRDESWRNQKCKKCHSVAMDYGSMKGLTGSGKIVDLPSEG